MLFSYYIGSPRKVCLLHHSTWFGFSTWCDDILSNVRIQQFVKSAKTFFFPFFFYLKILLFSYLLHYWICANSTENSLTLSSWGDEKGVYYVLPFRNWERKKMYCNLMDVSHDFCKTQCIFCLKVHFLILGETLQICLETPVLDQAIWICTETNL